MELALKMINWDIFLIGLMSNTPHCSRSLHYDLNQAIMYSLSSPPIQSIQSHS